ncbi:hypothetical protein [Flagellimonas okinawensis]|uniref:Uncharacterized protein n=1 Tax=Flagellimonas okinawensis TaxID=3031324 RepID=A0ABT5XL76_9FLAO|nr:hypothetical protein [[Muricauda] okinawensis]MDF0706644.1 hypothetical protein [[Muricauda] okinawensis]
MKKIYDRAFTEFKKNQLGYSTIAIIGQSCIGSAAAMVLLMGTMDTVLQMVLLFLVTISCMAFNGAVLAQLKPLTTFNLLILSIVFNTLVIMFHIW